MIDIRVQPGRRVDISGHAMFAAKGQDIVCAGVSALFCTLRMADGIGFAETDGTMSAMVCKPAAGEILRLFCKGFENIAKQYPTYVRYKVVPIDLG